ncbi:MAG: AAA family ATPase [Leptospiraceae bacterium]|nr:AAA family ATPase [Leptospiraceae bacterium]
MNNIKSVLDQVKKHFPKQFKIAYRFPYTFLILTHPDFTDDEEENEIKFCNLLNIEPQYIRDISNLSLLSLECLSQEDFDKREIKNRGTYWSELRIEEELDLLNKTKTENEDPLKVIHFFGYKGGQGRSSVLTALSLNLMKYGWKVLVIDADFEAPSLDLIYNKDLKLENTLLGLYLGKKINAINYDSKPSGGSIDIIGAKPSLIYNEMSELEDDWSIEYSGMTLQANVNPATIQILAKGLQSFAKENLYDIVLVDQRSGMSISSITWINELIGQLVLFTRLDNQWQHSYQFLKSLVLNSNSSDIPIISQKPYMTKDLAPIDKDHFERQKEDLKFLFVKNKQIKEGLDIDDISVGDINANFLDWQYDPSYRDNLLPDTEQILSENLLVLQKLRSILEIESDKSKFIKPDYSGIKDEGLLILTDALNKLLNKNNDINYIYGRKGTGKTKIFAELVSRNLAKPLIAQDDYFLERKNAEGINGRSDTVKNIIWSFNKEIKKLENSRIEDIDGLVENFWWCIFLTAIETISKHGSLPNKVFEEEFKKKYENFKKESSNYSTKLKSILVSQEEKITFCIDGLETTFDVYYINYYVKALYGVMNTILTDSYFEKIQVKLFLRKDLKPEFIQNSEQKDSIELVWTEQAILNFLFLDFWLKRKEIT